MDAPGFRCLSTPLLDGSGTDTAECAVSRGGEVVDTLTSLEMQIS